MATTIKRRQPVHQRIAADLETHIRRDLRVGAKLPSETRLAATFGVSSLTVREAVARLVQKGLVERRQGSGTYVADHQALCHVGILVNLKPDHLTVTGYWLPLVAQIRRLLETFGYRVRTYNGDDLSRSIASAIGCAELAQDMADEHLLGVIVLGQPAPPALAAELRARAIPVAGECDGTAYRFQTDYDALYRRALRHLVAAGCRRVAVLRWGIDAARCRELMAAAGLPTEDVLVMDVSDPASTGIGYSLSRDLFADSAHRPDGLLLGDELLLPGVSFAILEAGLRVPRDLRIATHAVEGAPIFSPLPVTAFAVSPEASAEQMAGIMARLIRGERPPSQVLNIPITLVERPGGPPPAPPQPSA